MRPAAFAARAAEPALVARIVSVLTWLDQAHATWAEPASWESAPDPSETSGAALERFLSDVHVMWKTALGRWLSSCVLLFPSSWFPSVLGQLVTFGWFHFLFSLVPLSSFAAWVAFVGL